jgi:hypothetical protein
MEQAWDFPSFSKLKLTLIYAFGAVLPPVSWEQVPAGMYIHGSPWLSAGDAPAQEREEV